MKPEALPRASAAAPRRRREGLRTRLTSIKAARTARQERRALAVRRARAWAPAAKAAVLFVLPLPLALAAVAAIVDRDLGQVLLCGGAAACVWSAGAAAFQGLAAEARYALHQRDDLPLVPFKLLSAVLTALGAALAAIAAGQTPALLVILVVLSLAGHLAFFGRDLRPRRIRVATAEGVDSAAIEALLAQAHRRLRRLDSAAAAIAAPALSERVAGVAAKGRAILAELERRPAEASRARRFLNVYVDGAERVTSQYAAAASRGGGRELDQQFSDMLADIEKTFDLQHRRLVEREQLALDIDIEVLTARLRQEALANLENQS